MLDLARFDLVNPTRDVDGIWYGLALLQIINIIFHCLLEVWEGLEI